MAESRPYAGPADLRALQHLAQQVWRFDRRVVDEGGTVGELACGMGGISPDERRPRTAPAPREWEGRTWLHDGTLIAWATLMHGRSSTEPGTLDWQIHPAHIEMLPSVLDWGEQASEGGSTATSVRPANERAVAILQQRGYEPDTEAAWMLLNVRSLDEIEKPDPPPGYELKTMADVRDVERRVAVHRAAWEGSRVTTELYDKIMETWPYRADLDCVLQAPDGTLVASVMAWFDPDNRLGEFEPVGTHPDYRRRGLGRALNLFALQQLRAAGAREAIVACRGDPDYPIPKRLYESVGFRELSRQLRFIRR